MSTSKYVTKADVLAWLNYPDLTASDIPDQVLKTADARIHAYLLRRGFHVKKNKLGDKLNLLWSAALCMCLELLCYNGIVTWTTGDLAMHKLNRTTHTYQRWQPMFFFAQGSAKGFEALLPHETYRMMAFAFCEAYANKHFFDKYNRVVAIPKIVVDDTSRGYRWNLDTDIIEAEDQDITSSDSLINDKDSFDYPLESD